MPVSLLWNRIGSPRSSERNRRREYVSNCGRFKIKGDGRGHFALYYQNDKISDLSEARNVLSLTDCKQMAENHMVQK